MARQEKKTRIKGLPPKLFLQQKDARTGSMPSVARIASDNRTGKYNVQFDDTSTIVFTTQSAEVSFGAGIRTQDLLSKYYQEFGQDISTSLSGVGSVSKTVASEFVSYTPGQSWQPYKESAIDSWAADGKSVPVGQKVNPFYATGSFATDVGEGFEGPLWAKSKIEIDLTPSRIHSFGINNYLSTSNNYPMAYWNKDSKTFEGIGTGREFAAYDSGSSRSITPDTDYEQVASGAKMMEEQCIGFTPSISETFFDADVFSGTSFADLLHGFAQPMSSFGFPFHPKYHGTSSNLIDMSDLISEPFMAEKMVLEFSMSFDRKNTHSAYNRYPITTFFVMNQRDKTNYTRRKTEHKFGYGTGLTFPDLTEDGSPSTGISLPISHSLPYKAPDWQVFTDRPSVPFPTFTGTETSRDILGWMQISHLDFAATSSRWQNDFGAGGVKDHPQKALGRELVFFGDPDPLNPKFDAGPMGHPSGRSPAQSFSGKFIMSASLKSPVKNAKKGWRKTSAGGPSGIFPNENRYLYWANWHIGTGSAEANGVGSWLALNNQFGARDGLGRPSGRDLVNVITEPESNSVIGASSFGNTGTSFPTQTYKTPYITSPYLLLPTDKLIIGWQVPVHPRFNAQIGPFQSVTGSYQASIYNGQGPTLEFPMAGAKLVIYGSKVSQGKESHDTLNQLLTSNAVHEIIE